MADKKQIEEVALAAVRAAYGKAREMGLTNMDAVLGIAAAADAAMAATAVAALFGADGPDEIVRAIADKRARDAVAEAEEILKGEGDD